jgi:hypothetical protein
MIYWTNLSMVCLNQKLTTPENNIHKLLHIFKTVINYEMNYIFSCIQAYNSCLDSQIYMPVENKLFQIRQIYVVYRLCEIFFRK